MSDDIGYKTLTVNGGKSYSTPNLDSMAHNGMNFTQCHASPLCSPSRFTLLTGKYNFRNYTQWGVMDTGQKTIGNMFHDAGYKTACFGKWQLSGGDASIRKFGFDSYCVFSPFGGNPVRYKNPDIYTNSAEAPDSETNGKYSEDIFSDSVMNFIERNKTSPFFVYYSMVLAHDPFQPTPDNADFSTWTYPYKSDTSYYASMIHYMDKKIGQIINKVKELGIENNTVIFFAGDNGTPVNISEYIDDDSIINGGKSTTTEFGTHVPLIAYWPGIITNTINDDLIDFTDFLPTLAGIANIPVPATYGPLDGVSFAARLTNNQGTPRDWIFDHYDAHLGASKFARWAQTKTYKLYDTSSSKKTRLFYNITNDINEKRPIPDSMLTADEVNIKQQLLDVITNYIAQGLAIFRNPVLSKITDSSAVISDSIQINGGSTITVSGAVWSTTPNPVISSSSHTSDGKISDLFQTTAKGLAANTTYYIRVYATNYAGTSYGKQISFKTLSHAPVATEGTLIDSNKFTANWKSIAGKNSYSLDVSESPAFTKVTASNLFQGFNNGLTPPAGWIFGSNIYLNNNYHGSLKPSLVFNTSLSQITTKSLGGVATQLKFWIKGLGTNAASSFLIEGFNGNTWIVIKKLTNISTTASTKIFNASSGTPLPDNISQFRFTYTKSAGTVAFDDVSINYNVTSPSFVSGYNNLTVKATYQLVTGLKAGVNYYYRVRSSGTTNSNVIITTTCKKPVITNLNLSNITCTGNNDGLISPTLTGGVGAFTYNWTGPNNFTSAEKDIRDLSPGNYKLTITANGGCAMDTVALITEPTPLNASAAADSITCSGGKTTLTVTATGGTGNYHYTLSDGTNTTGPQDDNHFTVGAGNYTVVVEDDNHCSFTTSAIQITEPPALNATASADAINCSGGTTTLTVTATGGTGDYHYTLSDGTNTTGPQDDNHFTVGAGNYTVVVEDDNHCSFTTSAIQITEPTALNATASADAINCSGGTTTLTVAATGGTGNYHYTLSDGTNTTGPQDDNHFTVGAGNYTVIVEDDNHCSFTTSAIQITEPTALNATASADAINCLGGTTTLTVTATGGTGNYHYTLSDGTNTTGPQDDNHFTVSAGNYTVVVEDDNGCNKNIDITISDGTENCNAITSNNNNAHDRTNVKANKEHINFDVQIFPNPTHNQFSLKVETKSNAEIEISITDICGRKVYETKGGSHTTHYFGENFSSGIYFVKIVQGINYKIYKVLKAK